MKTSSNVSTSRIAVPEAISSIYHQDNGVHRLEVQSDVTRPCKHVQKISETVIKGICF